MDEEVQQSSITSVILMEMLMLACALLRLWTGLTQRAHSAAWDKANILCLASRRKEVQLAIRGCDVREGREGEVGSNSTESLCSSALC